MIVAFAAISLMFSTACNRSAWELARDRRLEKMHRQIVRYQDHDAAGARRLEKTSSRLYGQHCLRQAHLEKTRTFVRGEMQSDIDRWYGERSKRAEFWGEQWRGQPEGIPKAWERMIY